MRSRTFLATSVAALALPHDPAGNHWSGSARKCQRTNVNFALAQSAGFTDNIDNITQI